MIAVQTKEQKQNRMARIFYLSLAVFFAILCPVLIYGAEEKTMGIGAGAMAIGNCALHAVAHHEHKYHGE